KCLRSVATARAPSKGRSASAGKTLDNESPTLTAELQARGDPGITSCESFATNSENNCRLCNIRNGSIVQPFDRNSNLLCAALRFTCVRGRAGTMQRIYRVPIVTACQRRFPNT